MIAGAATKAIGPLNEAASLDGEPMFCDTLDESRLQGERPMFADACKVASQFTQPVIVSTRTLDESVKSGCMAFIVLNKDGWAMTAAHLFGSYMAFQEHKSPVKEYRARVAAIEGETQLNARQRAKKIRRVKSDPRWIINHSFWWGRDNVKLKDVKALGGIDLAVVRLEPWDATWMSDYPTIKDPTKEMQPGRSLCRLGFPFHNINTTYDEERNGFVLDKSETPFFALEGIYTRNVAPGTKADGYEVKFLETSSPGLRGHSGGPIFDVHGTVWAVQSRTHHYELEFSPTAKKGRRETVEHQFLSVGWAVHPDVIVAFLRDNDIEFQLADY